MILLQPLQESTQQLFCRFLSYEATKENLEYMQYYTDGRPKPIKDCENLMKQRLNRMYNSIKPTGLYFLIRDLTTQEVIGQITIGSFDSSSDPEIAYIILKDFGGKKYATNAVIMVTNFVKKHFLRTSMIVADAHPGNIASRRVLENAGFVEKEKGYIKETAKGPRCEYVLNLQENQESL